ncbi:MAG TPA: phosphoglucomutase/phosphomannomutase family protein [Bacillota bacterium]|nr:phosphoglucomutase/phosphomannomutase family protein [Bacillota bacterium]
MTSIKFGTDGWRAIIADQFTFDNVKIVIQAIADYIKAQEQEQRGLVIGYDTRFLAEEFAQKAAEVLAANGIKVLLTSKAAPTPVTAFAIKSWKTAGAIMFTASHNPPEYNGVKFIPEYAGPASPEITRDLEVRISKVLENREIMFMDYKLAVEKGLVVTVDPRPIYEKHLTSLINLKLLSERPRKVGVDPMYGAGIGYVSTVLKQCGWEVTAIHEFRDPLFGGSLPEPKEDKLQELVAMVKQGKVELGLANDGDADRFGVIDSDGTYISPNEVISLLLMHLVKNRKMKGDVVRTVATTHLIDAIAEKYGLKLHETPVGFKYVAEKMLQEQVLIGGEESGGLSIYGHIPEKDGILANLLMAELGATEEKTFGELLHQIRTEFGDFANMRIDLHLSEDKKQRIMDKLSADPPQAIGVRQVVSQNLSDGVKLYFDDKSWVLFRPSGTEPLLRIYMEALGRPRLDDLANDINKYLDSY